MNKKQIFDIIVNSTASVCGVSAEAIKGTSRNADVVDARCMAFRYALSKEVGFTPRDIATLLGRDDLKAIRTLSRSYQDRYDRSFCFRRLAAFLREEISRGGVFSNG